MSDDRFHRIEGKVEVEKRPILLTAENLSI